MPEYIPRHRAHHHEDACGLACEADRGGVNCIDYVGRHRAEPTS